jgi:hypothetical protein
MNSMKHPNIRPLIAMSLSVALLGLAACGNDKPQTRTTPTETNTPSTPAAPRSPMMGQPVAGQPFPGQPMPGQPFPGQPFPNQPFPTQPMPEMPAENVALDIKITQDRRSRAVAEVIMTEAAPGILAQTTARLSKRHGTFTIANLDKTVIFGCRLLEEGGTQCIARLTQTRGMVVSAVTGSFRSQGLNLLDFSGAEAVTERAESRVLLKVSDSTGASFALVMIQDRDNRSEPLISIEGQATASN